MAFESDPSRRRRSRLALWLLTCGTAATLVLVATAVGFTLPIWLIWLKAGSAVVLGLALLVPPRRSAVGLAVYAAVLAQLVAMTISPELAWIVTIAIAAVLFATRRPVPSDPDRSGVAGVDHDCGICMEFGRGLVSFTGGRVRLTDAGLSPMVVQRIRWLGDVDDDAVAAPTTWKHAPEGADAVLEAVRCRGPVWDVLGRIGRLPPFIWFARLITDAVGASGHPAGGGTISDASCAVPQD